MSIGVHDLFSVSTNVVLKFRGFWSPLAGSLPNTTTYPTGSLLIASNSNTIGGTQYLQNSIILNNNNSWQLAGAGSGGAPITFSDMAASSNLDNFTGLDGLGNFVYQVVTVLSGVVGSTTNLPVANAGVLEVFGHINVQRYTTQTNRIFTRLLGTPNQTWTEITTDPNLANIVEIMYDEQYSKYSKTGVSSN